MKTGQPFQIAAKVVIKLLFILSMFHVTGVAAQQQGSWQRKKDFPESLPSPRIWALSFTIGDKGYMGTGYIVGEDIWKSDFWEYDAATDTWSQKAKIPKQGGSGFSIGGKGYGLSGTGPQDFWEYDPVMNRWSAKAGLPDSIAAIGLSFRFSVGSKGYFGTGDKVFFEYDPATDAWTRLGDFRGVSRWGGVGFSIGNKGYFGLGGAESGNLNDFWEYDPAADNWTPKNNFPAAGYAQLGLSAGSKGFIGVDIKDFWEYDPTLDSWTRRSALTGDYWGWGDGFAFAAGARVYVGKDLPNDNFKEFDPANNTWSSMKDLEDQRKSKMAGFSVGNKGYFGTGSYGYAFSRDFWEYDPALDSWTQKADFGGTARDGAVGLSIGGKGYIGTGKDSSGERNDFWEYDPVTNTWLRKPDFPGGMVSGARSFTIGDKGYIVEPSSHRLWQYDPSSDQWTQKATLTGGTFSGVVSFAIGNKGYYGGADYQGFFEYDPVADNWTMKSSIIKTLDDSRNLGASNIAAFSIGNKGYLSVVLYELYGGPHPGMWEHFYQYDAEKDEWVDLEPFSRLTGSVAMTISNKGYVLFTPDYEMWEYTAPYCTTYYRDADGDGFGNRLDSIAGCAQPPGYTTNNTDCNDNDKTNHAPVSWYRDLDRDGYGDSFNPISACSNVPPAGYVTNNYDCYDSGTVSHPEWVRVRMCHNGWTQCVNASEIRAKLCLGWTMGPCSLQTCAADETLLCHNGRQECVKTIDVPKYLADANWWPGPYCSGTVISRKTSNKTVARPLTKQSLPAPLKMVNYPNPFSGTSTIYYELPLDSKVSIKVYDLMGRTVATLVDENKKAGNYTVNFNAHGLSSGSLYYRIIALSKHQQFQQTNQMIRIK
jgi:N-acetylneuraminic acid mutarotase